MKNQIHEIAEFCLCQFVIFFDRTDRNHSDSLETCTYSKPCLNLKTRKTWMLIHNRVFASHVFAINAVV